MSHNVPSLEMYKISCHCATQCPINTSLTTMSHATNRGGPMGHRRHTGLQPVRWRQTQSPPSSSNRQPPFTLRSRSEFRFVVPPSGGLRRHRRIGNLHYPNVRFCPVLSGLLNTIPVITLNIFYQQDLQHFPSRSRPDIPDISRKNGHAR